MAKRSIEQIIDETKQFKAVGMSTLQAMAATLEDAEWDDLIILIERLQAFWRSHADQQNTRD